ncbi:class I adenylate-forming enzyme family protein [Aquitalea sp. LB_tupeE]|uniref:class I adenylate-forming enzyme family protein n=1 Tax=Aquitalea sp. LB_tupeE TaxID=2748078 RepID=UPI0015B97EA1|nr:long-chain fatty acid--CoA ligase [Aquitalea sp. LB_tupeE]NWK79675.1 AMP-binding protein [Aquitalea sp. LB_tupeE]
MIQFGVDRQIQELTQRLPTIREQLKMYAARNGLGIAWEDPERGESITFSQQNKRKRQLTACLSSLPAQSVICLVLTRSKDFLPLLAACIQNNLVLAPIGEDARKIKEAIKILKPRLIISTSDLATSCIKQTNIDNYIELPSEYESTTMMHDDSEAHIKAIEENHDLSDATCLLIQTSGTTGQAKYVQLSERSLVSNAAALQVRYQCQTDDRIHCTLPWSHMNAIMMTGCLALLAGATVVYRNIVKEPDPISALHEVNPSISSLTPTLLSFILSKKKSTQNLKMMRFIFCGAAPLSSILWKKAENSLSCKIYQGYGLSETTCWIASTVPEEMPDYETVGKVLLGEIYIPKQNRICIITQTTELSDSNKSKLELGPIFYKGPLQFKGYRGKTQEPIRDGAYFDTGDIGYIDNNNNIRFVGRQKEIIIRSGINIVPEVVDSLLREHPEILACKTIGIQDDLLGERVVTTYISRNSAPLNEIDLRRFIRNRIQADYIPNSFIQLNSFPINETGKISTVELRKKINGDYARAALLAIDTNRFKRANCSDREKITAQFQSRILRDLPLHFLTYWGAGQRNEINENDVRAMQRIKEMLEVTCSQKPLMAEITLIFTDIHAKLNGKSANRVDLYFQRIEKLAAQHGFNCVRASDIWNKSGINPEDLLNGGTTLSLVELSDELGLGCMALEMLRKSAQRHVEIGDAADGLRNYLYICSIEKKLYADEFSESVFLTYNDPCLSTICPDLPKMYIYSFSKGMTAKPWFS